LLKHCWRCFFNTAWPTFQLGAHGTAACQICGRTSMQCCRKTSADNYYPCGGKLAIQCITC